MRFSTIPHRHECFRLARNPLPLTSRGPERVLAFKASHEESRLIRNVPRFRWLCLDNADERAVYLDHWRSNSNRRPHDHPAYLDLVKPDGYAAAVVLYQHAMDAVVTYPFFWCEVNRFTPFRALQRPLRHMVSPYGYGGPLYEGEPAHKEAASRAFEDALHLELRERRFVSEFVREDIFPERLVRRLAGTTRELPNVLVKLDRDEDEIWAGYKPAVRRNVRLAARNALTVVFDPTGKRLDCFTRIYYDTMARRGANRYFFFPEQGFQDLNTALGSVGASMFVHVLDGDTVVSSELLLLSGTTIYSFLSATLPSAFAKRPNNLLKHEIALWGHRNGYKWLVLGGGLTQDDELLRYKRSFDPNHITPYSVRRIIHAPEDYQRLVSMAHDFMGKKLDRENEEETFPEYFRFQAA
jgi:hypothetical protein